ncbi:MAG: putative glycoside hydrolase [Candidatus Magasanikbacteria bacterium]|nr:putative glycoside hydrolase [Candidatus Magasanikbacteria bacterium]
MFGILLQFQNMFRQHSVFNLVCFLVISLGAAGSISDQWAQAETEIVSTSTPATVTVPSALPLAAREKPPAQTVKGIYLTAYSAASPDKLRAILRLIQRTELNAVVIDIKDYTGYVLYDSAVPLVNQLKTKKPILSDLSSIITQLHQAGVYVMARQVVFQDPVLAGRRPEWAIKSKRGGRWRDYKGLTWVDPTRREVWEYNLAIAKEAISLGFDEINFDYIRFPSDGNIRLVKYTNGNQSRAQVMAKFYQYLGEELGQEPAWISLDLFGLTMEAAGQNDLNIGQRIADAAPHVDYISPMMYPSHYPRGHLGLKNPAAAPAKVIAYGLKLGLPKFADKRARVRPWLQAFNLGAVYDAKKIRAQIDAVEKVSDAGWLLWNSRNHYTAAGLKTELAGDR